MSFYILGSILSLTLWLYLTFCHGKRKIFKSLSFWSSKIVFENLKFKPKGKKRSRENLRNYSCTKRRENNS